MKLIAGVDEVGRGPLAGPVLAAAVIFPKPPRIRGLKDSKLLNAQKRLDLFEIIKAKASCWAVGIASVKEIDTLNIYHANLLAMKRAVNNLLLVPDEILVDGNRCPDVSMPAQAIVGGDNSIPLISAASVVAKVTRDYLMGFFDIKYPQYGFGQHKGYGTKQHLQALKKFGVTPLHRKSFAPVRELIQTSPSDTFLLL